MNIIFYLFQELKLLNSCNILLHLLRIHLICATLHLHQISGTIFSLCFNAHGNPHPGFHFWISLLFQQRIHSDFWWCYSFTATLSDPTLTQVACTPGKCYGTSEILTNPFCIEFIFIQFLYCLFILTILKCIQKVLSKTYGLCIFSISSYNQCPCWRNQWPYRPYYKEAV